MRRLVIACLATALLPASAAAETVRFAVVAGHNAGGGDLPPLRYAESDAGKMARVLTELGDVRPGNLSLLQGQPVSEVEAAVRALVPKVKAVHSTPEDRAVLLFYFSGHSDGEVLEFGKEGLPYSRLKALLSGTGADVRVAIIDACRSGAALRQKGGRPVDPFVIRLNDTLAASGEVFITSSAENEAALESKEVLGSVFTHHLISGLRGAADASGDQLVTLGEAYRYAYDQTVAGTAMTSVGAQHPSYDYRISGQGELVLASLQRATARLLFPVGSERAVVLDTVRDQVIAETSTASTRGVALPPGHYGVRLYKSGQSFGGRVSLAEGDNREVSWEELTPITAATAIARKGPGVAAVMVDAPATDDDRLLQLAGGVVPSVSQLGLQGLVRLGFEPTQGHGFSFALQGALASSGALSEGGVEARVGYRFAWTVGRFWFGAGLEAGPALLWQTSARGTASGPAGVLAPRGSARVRLGGPVYATLDGEAGLALLSVDGAAAVKFRPSGAAGLALRF